MTKKKKDQDNTKKTAEEQKTKVKVAGETVEELTDEELEGVAGGAIYDGGDPDGPLIP